MDLAQSARIKVERMKENQKNDFDATPAMKTTATFAVFQLFFPFPH